MSFGRTKFVKTFAARASPWTL